MEKQLRHSININDIIIDPPFILELQELMHILILSEDLAGT